jgi:hypothetical protein
MSKVSVSGPRETNLEASRVGDRDDEANMRRAQELLNIRNPNRITLDGKSSDEMIRLVKSFQKEVFPSDAEATGRLDDRTLNALNERYGKELDAPKGHSVPAESPVTFIANRVSKAAEFTKSHLVGGAKALLHGKFHEAGAEVIQLADAGKTEAAAIGRAGKGGAQDAVHDAKGWLETQRKKLETLAPGDTVAITLSAEARIAWGVEGEVSVSVKHEFDGSYSVECGGKAGLNASLSAKAKFGYSVDAGAELEGHVTLGAKVKFTVQSASDALGFAQSLYNGEVALIAQARISGAPLPRGISSERADAVMKHLTSVAVETAITGNASASLKAFMGLDASQKLSAENSLALNFENGHIKSLSASGTCKSIIAGGVDLPLRVGNLNLQHSGGAAIEAASTTELTTTMNIKSGFNLAAFQKGKVADLGSIFETPSLDLKLSLTKTLTTHIAGKLTGSTERKEVVGGEYTFKNVNKSLVTLIVKRMSEGSLEATKEVLHLCVNADFKKIETSSEVKKKGVKGEVSEADVKAEGELKRTHDNVPPPPPVVVPHASIVYNRYAGLQA